MTAAGRAVWTTCAYPGCHRPLGYAVVDDGAGASKGARCPEHSGRTYPCPRCLPYSHAARIGRGAWPGCPACGGSGWLGPRLAIAELAAAVRGQTDGRRYLWSLLRAAADGGVLVYDVERETIRVDWIGPGDLAFHVTETGESAGERYAAPSSTAAPPSPRADGRPPRLTRPSSWLAKAGLLPRRSSWRRP